MRLAITLAAVLLSWCVTTASAQAETLSPDADGCEGAIARWQQFAERENQGGHMDASVHDKIQAEIEQATAVCRSGQDAQATRMVEASKRRHGY